MIPCQNPKVLTYVLTNLRGVTPPGSPGYVTGEVEEEEQPRLFSATITNCQQLEFRT